MSEDIRAKKADLERRETSASEAKAKLAQLSGRARSQADAHERQRSETLVDEARKEVQQRDSELETARTAERAAQVSGRGGKHPDTAGGQSAWQDREGLPPRPDLDTEAGRPTEHFLDHHEVRAGLTELKQVDGLRREKWDSMSEGERVKTLQEAENRLAKVQGRPPEQVHAYKGDPGSYGEYVNPQEAARRKLAGEPNAEPGIHVNSRHLEDPATSLNTVAHEGKHAQHHQMSLGRQAHPDEAKNQGLVRNDTVTYVGHDQDPRGYTVQATERNAGSYGYAVQFGMYPETKKDFESPTQGRAVDPDRYNAANAAMDFGKDYGRTAKMEPMSSRSSGEAARQTQVSASSFPSTRPGPGQRAETWTQDKKGAKTVCPGDGQPGGSLTWEERMEFKANQAIRSAQVQNQTEINKLHDEKIRREAMKGGDERASRNQDMKASLRERASRPAEEPQARARKSG